MDTEKRQDHSCFPKSASKCTSQSSHLSVSKGEAKGARGVHAYKWFSKEQERPRHHVLCFLPFFRFVLTIPSYVD